MIVRIPYKYCHEVLNLMITTWHDGWGSFIMKEIQELVDRLGHFAQAYQPLYHLMFQLYGSVTYALKENKHFMTSTSFQF